MRLQLREDLCFGQVEAERFQRDFELVVVDVAVVVEVEEAEGFVYLFALLFAEAFEELGVGGFAALVLDALLLLRSQAVGFALLVCGLWRLLWLGLGLCEGCGVGGAVGCCAVVGLVWACWVVVGAGRKWLVICSRHCGLCVGRMQLASDGKLDALYYARTGRRRWIVVLYARGVVICETFAC